MHSITRVVVIITGSGDPSGYLFYEVRGETSFNHGAVGVSDVLGKGEN